MKSWWGNPLGTLAMTVVERVAVVRRRKAWRDAVDWFDATILRLSQIQPSKGTNNVP
jgi:hypothetical protein